METLKELVRIVNRNKVKRIEIIGDPNSTRTKLQELYEGLTNGEFETNKEIANYFFPESPYQTAYANRLQKKIRAKAGQYPIFHRCK